MKELSSQISVEPQSSEEQEGLESNKIPYETIDNTFI